MLGQIWSCWGRLGVFCLVGTGRSGGQEPRNILAYLLGIGRYLLGTPTSNLRSDLRGGGGGGRRLRKSEA